MAYTRLQDVLQRYFGGTQNTNPNAAFNRGAGIFGRLGAMGMDSIVRRLPQQKPPDLPHTAALGMPSGAVGDTELPFMAPPPPPATGSSLTNVASGEGSGPGGPTQYPGVPAGWMYLAPGIQGPGVPGMDPNDPRYGRYAPPDWVYKLAQPGNPAVMSNTQLLASLGLK